MVVEYLNDNNRGEWDRFALESGSAWFRHTTFWLDYSSCCRFDSNTRNFSFMVKQNSHIQAIVPLLAEYSYPERDFDCFTMYGDYTPMPCFSDNLEVSKSSVVELIREEMLKIVSENNIHYGKFLIDPLITNCFSRDFAPFDIFGGYPGFSANFATTNIVDLRQDEDSILRVMRKGHKAAIKQVFRDGGFRVDKFDRENIDKKTFLIFKHLHFVDAGRQTRTDASWDCMFEWIMAGNAFLALLWEESASEYKAGALVMMYKKSAYYASFGTSDSGLLKGHAGYAIQWEIIRYLKAKGYEFYETGPNKYQVDNNSLKVSEISKYKRGFRSLEFQRLTFFADFIQMLETINKQ